MPMISRLFKRPNLAIAIETPPLDTRVEGIMTVMEVHEMVARIVRCEDEDNLIAAKPAKASNPVPTRKRASLTSDLIRIGMTPVDVVDAIA